MGDKKIIYNIFLAAMEGADQEISSFLEAGESVNSTSKYGETPLHFASGFNKGQIVCL